METNRYHKQLSRAIAGRQMPLSPDFTARTLTRLRIEQVRRERRAEIWGLAISIILSLILIAVAAITFHAFEMPSTLDEAAATWTNLKHNISLYFSDSLPYYGLALLAGLLLLIDYYYRQQWYSRHKEASKS